MRQEASDDRRLAAAALEKRRLGQKPSQHESRALRRVERERDEAQRLAAYRSIRKRDWRQWSGRPDKILNEQSVRYGLPIGGAEIDLPAVVRWLHDFLAENKFRLAAPDPDEAALSGAASPAQERYRLARAKREEFFLERDLGEWIARDKVHDAIGIFADVIRRAGETLQRQFGPSAHDILERAVANAVTAYASHFDQSPTDAAESDDAAESAAR